FVEAKVVGLQIIVDAGIQGGEPDPAKSPVIGAHQCLQIVQVAFAPDARRREDVDDGRPRVIFEFHEGGRSADLLRLHAWNRGASSKRRSRGRRRSGLVQLKTDVHYGVSHRANTDEQPDVNDFSDSHSASHEHLICAMSYKSPETAESGSC